MKEFIEHPMQVGSVPNLTDSDIAWADYESGVHDLREKNKGLLRFDDYYVEYVEGRELN